VKEMLEKQKSIKLQKIDFTYIMECI